MILLAELSAGRRRNMASLPSKFEVNAGSYKMCAINQSVGMLQLLQVDGRSSSRPVQPGACGADIRHRIRLTTPSRQLFQRLPGTFDPLFANGGQLVLSESAAEGLIPSGLL